MPFLLVAPSASTATDNSTRRAETRMGPMGLMRLMTHWSPESHLWPRPDCGARLTPRSARGRHALTQLNRVRDCSCDKGETFNGALRLAGQRDYQG